MSNLLDVRDLTKTFGGLTVLDRVSFTLEADEIVGVVGPNGSGKTTLLRCVVGADAADSGQVLLDGDELDETSASVRSALACVLDDVDFFPDLSALEHLRLYAWSHGDEAADTIAEEVLDELELADAADQLPFTLSGGQRQRLALASCLVRPRRLLVLDEPEQHLDVAGRRWLAGRLAAEREAGNAVLLASHDQELLGAIVDYVVEVDG